VLMLFCAIVKIIRYYPMRGSGGGEKRVGDVV
jgi:hypothetical protein